MWKQLLPCMLLVIGMGGLMGCMDNRQTGNPPASPDQEAVAAKLEETYKTKFEVVGVKKGGVTTAGRFVPDRFHVLAEDGTYFSYTEQADGEIDDFYPDMKFGNDYFRNELQAELDAIYGKNKIRGQAFISLAPTSDQRTLLHTYDYKQDSEKVVSVYLAVMVDDFEPEAEAKKALQLYNAITQTSAKDVQIGYFAAFPDDLDSFLRFETTGKDNTFEVFFAAQMKADLLINSRSDGDTLTPAQIEALFETDWAGER